MISNETNSPLVSVCIPTWNRAHLVIDAISSALSQEGCDLEVIVGDNASDDNTVALVEELAKADSRVSLLKNATNIRCYPNCVELMKVAKGRYIKFLMSDDVLRPGALARMTPYLEDPGVKLVSSRLNFVDHMLRPMEQPWWTAPPVPTDSRVPGILFGDHCFVTAKNYAHCPSNVMFRRTDVVPDDFATFNSILWAFSGDFATWLSLMMRGDVIYLVEPVADLRQHQGQGSTEDTNGALPSIEWLYLASMSTGYGFLADPEARRIAFLQAMRNLVAGMSLSVDDLFGPESLKALSFGVHLLADVTNGGHADSLGSRAFSERWDLFRDLARYREAMYSVATPLTADYLVADAI